MSKPKPRGDRESAIATLHNEIKTHDGFECAAVDVLRNKLKRQLSAWYEIIRGDITICVAQNEQTPWEESELKFPTRPMFKKSEHGFQQVGDYQIVINRMGALKDSFSSLLIERKGCTFSEEEMRGVPVMVGCDLYSTLLNKTGHERFTREIERFKADIRFDRMVVICECSYDQFLRFKPPFNGKKYNLRNYGATVESRIGVVNSLFVDHGVQVLFAGTRKRAIAAYRNAIRQAVMRDYARFIAGCE